LTHIEVATKLKQPLGTVKPGPRREGVMSSGQERNECKQAELVSAYALQALPRADAAAVEAHLSSCEQCRRDGGHLVAPPARTWVEPQWEKVAPGISCKMLANDEKKHVVSMLVRLAPGASYPPHTHTYGC